MSLKSYFLILFLGSCTPNLSAQDVPCQLPAAVLKLHQKVYPIKGGGSSYYKIFNAERQEGLIDSTGRILLETSNRFVGTISGDHVTVGRSDSSYMLFNLKTGQGLGLNYEAVSPDIQDGTITVKHNDAPQLIDLQNRVLIPSGMFESHSDAAEGRVPVLKNGLYGYSDYQGKVVIPAKYYYADGFYKGVGIVYAGDTESQLEGLVDRSGKEILKPVYRRILYVDMNISAENKKGKIALFRKDGTPLTDFIYDNIYDQTDNHYVLASRDHADFLLDSNGKELFESEYIGLNKDYGIAGAIKNGFAIAANYNSNGILKYGIIRYDGSIVQPLQYDYLDGFGETELVMLPAGTEKYGTIDYEGKQILSPEYDEILQKVDQGYVVRLDDKIGVVNAVGKILVPFEYDRLGDDRPLCVISLSRGDDTDYYDTNFKKL